jgi:hypothetical protein
MCIKPCLLYPYVPISKKQYKKGILRTAPCNQVGRDATTPLIRSVLTEVVRTWALVEEKEGIHVASDVPIII